MTPVDSRLKDIFQKFIRATQQTVRYVKDKYAEHKYRSDLAAMLGYVQKYSEMPAQGQAHFPTPPPIATIEAWSADQLRQEVKQYPISSINDKRLSHEFGFRNAIVQTTFPCVVELVGPQGAVIGVCKRTSGQMTEVERNHFLLVELMHLYGFITADERIVHGLAVIANSPKHDFNTRFSEKRQKQRNVGLIGPYRDMMMPIDTQDTNAVSSTYYQLKNNVSILGSVGGCLGKLRELAPSDKTAERLLAEFSRPGMLSSS
jgi:hypothetical protein